MIVLHLTASLLPQPADVAELVCSADDCPYLHGVAGTPDGAERRHWTTPFNAGALAARRSTPPIGGTDDSDVYVDAHCPTCGAPGFVWELATPTTP